MYLLRKPDRTIAFRRGLHILDEQRAPSLRPSVGYPAEDLAIPENAHITAAVANRFQSELSPPRAFALQAP